MEENTQKCCSKSSKKDVWADVRDSLNYKNYGDNNFGKPGFEKVVPVEERPGYNPETGMVESDGYKRSVVYPHEAATLDPTPQNIRAAHLQMWEQRKINYSGLDRSTILAMAGLSKNESSFDKLEKAYDKMLALSNQMIAMASETSKITMAIGKEITELKKISSIITVAETLAMMEKADKAQNEEWKALSDLDMAERAVEKMNEDRPVKFGPMSHSPTTHPDFKPSFLK